MPEWRKEITDLHDTLERLQVERLRLIGLLEEHLSPDLVEELVENPGRMKLGGKRETLAVLFCDLRGFTRFTEAQDADEVVTHLNQFFHAMTKVLFDRQATVDKFIGDAILAYFRPRDESPERLAARAVGCACEMRGAFASLSDRWHAGKSLGLGFGLSMGEVILGHVGSGRHVDYTVIGSAVNLAARLCTLAGPGEILITDTLAAALGSPEGWERLPAQTIKGFEEPVFAHLNRAPP